MKPFNDTRDWFCRPQLGMFVHWGLYAIDAWHEQIQWRQGISREDYVKLIDKFNPVNFEPDAWLDLAEQAGMEYICLTTKHHDGFCLWDTKQTDFNIMNAPYGKDIVAELADACHRRNFPLCLYYSVVDWHQPNYPNQGRHHEIDGPLPGDEPNMGKYVEFLKAQVRELCTNYGEIHGIWWDMNVPEHVDPSVNAMIRELQPSAVINNRGFDEGDYGTPERGNDHGIKGLQRNEACQSVGQQSWGYRKNEDYFSDRFLMESIAPHLAAGDNFLLNVGPDASGVIPPESAAILQRLGSWYAKVREAFDQTEAVPDLIAGNAMLLTRRDNTLYVIPKQPLQSSAISLKPMDTIPSSCTLLNTGEALTTCVDLPPYSFKDPKPFLRIRDISMNQLSNQVPVIRLTFDHLPE